MKKIFHVIVYACTILLVTACPPNTPPAKNTDDSKKEIPENNSERIASNYYKVGTSQLKQKKYNKAIASFTEAIKLKRDYADAYQNRGVAYMHLRKYVEASRDYDKLIKLKTKDPQTHVSFASVHYFHALALYKDTMEKKNTRTLAKDEEEKNTKKYFDFMNSAKDHFSQAIKLKSTYAEAYNFRGLVYYKTLEYQKAIDDFTMAIKLKNNYAHAYYNRASIYRLLKEYINSIADLKTAIKLDKKTYDVPQVQALLTKTQNLNKKYELTEEDFEEGITTIGIEQYQSKKLTRIIIPQTVKVIEKDAFAYNKLISVVIPEGVTIIKMRAFYGNKLTRVIIPKSVTTLESRAFTDNEELTEVVMSKTLYEKHKLGKDSSSAFFYLNLAQITFTTHEGEVLQAASTTP